MKLTKRSLGIARAMRDSGKSVACRYHALEVHFQLHVASSFSDVNVFNF